MQIKELYKNNEYGTDAYARTYNIIQRYMNKECVVAYLKGPIGMVFIIRSARKFYGFVSIKNDIWFGGYDYKLTEVPLKKALELMGDKQTIIDEELFGNMKKRMIVDNL